MAFEILGYTLMVLKLYRTKIYQHKIILLVQCYLDVAQKLAIPVTRQRNVLSLGVHQHVLYKEDVQKKQRLLTVIVPLKETWPSGNIPSMDCIYLFFGRKHYEFMD